MAARQSGLVVARCSSLLRRFFAKHLDAARQYQSMAQQQKAGIPGLGAGGMPWKAAGGRADGPEVRVTRRSHRPLELELLLELLSVGRRFVEWCWCWCLCALAEVVQRCLWLCRGVVFWRAQRLPSWTSSSWWRIVVS